MFISSRSLEIIGPKPLPVGKRPACLFCGRQLRPVFHDIEIKITYERGFFPQTIAKYFTGRYSLLNSYCGPRCAELWACRQPMAKQRLGEYPKLEQPPVPEKFERAMRMKVLEGR
jgi:hypothetical protein